MADFDDPFAEIIEQSQQAPPAPSPAALDPAPSPTPKPRPKPAAVPVAVDQLEPMRELARVQRDRARSVAEGVRKKKKKKKKKQRDRAASGDGSSGGLPPSGPPPPVPQSQVPAVPQPGVGGGASRHGRLESLDPDANPFDEDFAAWAQAPEPASSGPSSQKQPATKGGFQWESEVQQLANMGFSNRELAIKALTRYKGDINKALNILLNDPASLKSSSVASDAKDKRTVDGKDGAGPALPADGKAKSRQKSGSGDPFELPKPKPPKPPLSTSKPPLPTSKPPPRRQDPDAFARAPSRLRSWNPFREDSDGAVVDGGKAQVFELGVVPPNHWSSTSPFLDEIAPEPEDSDGGGGGGGGGGAPPQTDLSQGPNSALSVSQFFNSPTPTPSKKTSQSIPLGESQELDSKSLRSPPAKLERLRSIHGMHGEKLSGSQELTPADAFFDDFEAFKEEEEVALPSHTLAKNARWTTEERKKRERNAERVIREMIATEVSYCKGLEKLLRFFKYPLGGEVYSDTHDWGDGADGGGDDDDEDVYVAMPVPEERRRRGSIFSLRGSDMDRSATALDAKDVSKVFSNIELIFKLNLTFLQDLQSRPDAITKTFQTFSQYFKMYMPYVQSMELGAARLDELLKDSRVRASLEAQERSAGCTLSSLLILPVQRIPRYKLLLLELIKNKDPSDPEVADLAKAADEIVKVATHINNSIKRRENSKKLAEIQELFSGNVEIVAPGRRFVLQQELTKVTRGGAKAERVFFLFNDLLVYGSNDVAFSSKIRLRQVMPIDKSFLVSEVKRAEKDISDHLLYVSSSVKNITLMFAKDSDKQKWKRALTMAMKEQRKKIGFNYASRGTMLVKNLSEGKGYQKKDVFNHYGQSAIDEKAREDRKFYERMRHVTETRSYFENLSRGLKHYLAQQLAVVKASSALAVGFNGSEFAVQQKAKWYQAMRSTSTMAGVHAHEMLRWKSVTELFIDSITYVLKGPVTMAEEMREVYVSKCSEYITAKRNVDYFKGKRNPNADKKAAAEQAYEMATEGYDKAKKEAEQQVDFMDEELNGYFVGKLKFFVTVQADFHKDSYYDTRLCWAYITQLAKSGGGGGAAGKDAKAPPTAEKDPLASLLALNAGSQMSKGSDIFELPDFM